jgi:hypothetical protein
MSLLRHIPSGSYFDLLKRVIQRMQSAKIDDQIFEAVQKAYQKELTFENVVLSRAERDRLLRQVMKVVLTDMLKKLDNAK